MYLNIQKHMRMCNQVILIRMSFLNTKANLQLCSKLNIPPVHKQKKKGFIELNKVLKERKKKGMTAAGKETRGKRDTPMHVIAEAYEKQKRAFSVKYQFMRWTKIGAFCFCILFSFRITLQESKCSFFFFRHSPFSCQYFPYSIFFSLKQ